MLYSISFPREVVSKTCTASLALVQSIHGVALRVACRGVTRVAVQEVWSSETALREESYLGFWSGVWHSNTRTHILFPFLAHLLMD